MNKKNIKYLFDKWEDYIYSIISSLEIKTVYAMENIYTCKKGLHYAKIQLNLEPLRSYCLENMQIPKNRFNDLVGKNNLNIRGLFDKKHMFFLHKDMYNQKVLSSLTHSPSLKIYGSRIENILISEKDYLQCYEDYLKSIGLYLPEKEKRQDKSQFVGNLLNFEENERFFKSRLLSEDEEEALKCYSETYESKIKAGLKQQCQKRAIVLVDDIEKANRKQ